MFCLLSCKADCYHWSSESWLSHCSFQVPALEQLEWVLPLLSSSAHLEAGIFTKNFVLYMQVGAMQKLRFSCFLSLCWHFPSVHQTTLGNPMTAIPPSLPMRHSGTGRLSALWHYSCATIKHFFPLGNTSTPLHCLYFFPFLHHQPSLPNPWCSWISKYSPHTQWPLNYLINGTFSMLLFCHLQ